MEIDSVVSLVAAGIAVVALWLTKRQVDAAMEQTKLQRKVMEDAQQPKLWVDFRGDRQQGRMLQLVVCNEGPTVAKNVRVVFSPPLEHELGREIGSISTRLSQGLDSMPPGRELRWDFEMGHILYREDYSHPMRYTVTIGADGPFGPVDTDTFLLDLMDLKHTVDRPAGSLKDISAAIRELKP